MATVDLNNVQFWTQLSNSFLHKQRPATTVARHQWDGCVAGAQVYNESTACNDAVDDSPSIEEIQVPISCRASSIGGDRNAKSALQALDKPALDINGSRITAKQLRLDNDAGDSQGTRDCPVILVDNEPDSPEFETAAVSAAFELNKPIGPSPPERWYDVEAGCYVDEDLPLGLELEEQESLAAFTPAQDRGHSPHHQIGKPDNDRNIRLTSEEPAPHSSPKPLNEDGRGWSEENVSELEEHLLPAFEEQEKSLSATALSSPQPVRYTEQSHPQVDREDEKGGTSYSSLEEHRHDPPLHVQDQEEELQEQQHQQQQQEVAAAATNEEGENCDDDNRQQRGKKGEKRRRAEEAEEKVSSSGTADSDNDEGLRLAKRRQLSSPHDGAPLKRNREVHSRRLEGPASSRCDSQLESQKSSSPSPMGDEEPTSDTSAAYHDPESSDDSHEKSSGDDAKRRKPCSAPAHNGLTPQPQNVTPPSATQLEVPSRCDNQPESWKSSSPSPTGGEELTSNAGAAYQEWPMRGFFKLITIGNEVRYGMEFSLEDVQQLCAAAFPLHMSSTGSSASFSARPSQRAQAKNAPPRSKRPRFTEKEDAKLVDLKERECCSWGDIQRCFPGRSTASLQQRYSTKLKERNTTS